MALSSLSLERRGIVRPWAQARTASIEPERRLPRLVILLAVLVAAAAGVYSVLKGWPTLYNDAESHLDIARRVSDGLTPGLAQLGSVWLPLPQMLMAPLTAVDWLWHNGVAGTIVSGVAFAYSAVRVFSLAEEWTGKRFAGWAAFAVWVTNLNLLYMQSTPLDEIVMLACLVGAAFHMTRWTRTLSLNDLAFAGIFTFLGTITRYDAWAVFLTEIVIVFLWTRFRSGKRGLVQANTLVILTTGGYGIALWFLYNLIIFHDPLYFIHSTYSAQTQQLYQQQIGYLPTKGQIGTTLVTLGWCIVDVAGGAVIIAGLIGAVLMLFRRPPTLYRNLAVLAMLGAPIALNVVTLFVGQTTIRVPQMALHQMFNTRYGLEAMPLLAVCAGSLAAYLRGWLAAIPLGAAAYVAVTMWIATPVTLAEGQYGVSSDGAPQAQSVANYLRAHYAGGHILADDGAGSPLLFKTGLNLNQFVTVGFQPYYNNALANPAANVKWVVVYQRDEIDSQLHAHPDRYAQYTLVFQDDPIRLYEYTGPPVTQAPQPS